MSYETEEQQVEAIKLWWKNNATSVFTGVLIGLIAVFGWRYWDNHRNMIAAEASALFEQLVISVDKGQDQIAIQQVKTLQDNYKSTPYASFANLMEAKRLLAKNDITGAKKALQQVIDKAPEIAFKTIAVLRLARIQISSKDLQAATQLLVQYPPDKAFKAEYAALRGDIENAKGNIEAARQAYQEALNGTVGQADLIKLKLDNLPPAS
ncbi:hypothetical protein TI05_12175 [Achromatium sp. WMS3]|nr:hypothetical protein TI05_12175 [Achromatium sp. WMS3]